MKYKEIENLEEEKFRRLTGVKKATFRRMVEILDEEDRRKKAKSGRKSKLCIEDRLLMALEYMREYRTYFHIGQSYGMSRPLAKPIYDEKFLGPQNTRMYLRSILTTKLPSEIEFRKRSNIKTIICTTIFYSRPLSKFKKGVQSYEWRQLN